MKARSAFAPGASAIAATVMLVLSATTIVLSRIDTRTGKDYQLHTLLLCSDVALLALAVVAGTGLQDAVRAWRRHACALAGLVLGLTMVPALLVNPSDRGVAALLRWAGAMALALALGSVARDGRRLLIGGLSVVSAAHVAVAVGQRAKGGPLGLGQLGESAAVEVAGHVASTGLTVHPYVLAAWCAVAGTALLVVGRRWCGGRLAVVAGVLAFAGVGLTLSRAGAVAAILALGALALSTLGRDRTWRLTVLAAGAALAVGALLNAPGWVDRAGEASTSDVEDVSNGRGALLRQAGPLLRDHPITGVGPGRYVLALSDRPELVALSDQSPRPVHVTPLLLVVEGGLLVVPALVLLGLAIARACRRGGAPAVALVLAMLPFLALDHLIWSYPQGIVLAGVWLGGLDLVARKADDDDVELSEPPAAPA